jgi:hypothetical protein
MHDQESWDEPIEYDYGKAPYICIIILLFALVGAIVF